MKKRHALKLLTAAVLAASSVAALANPASGYPNGPIKIIVNFPAGGTADVLPRIVGEKLTAKWGQPVIVENRTGAGGNIGADAVAKAAPDGYTLLATPPGPLVINQYLYKALPFDPTRFAPITVLATVPNVLAVKKDLPVSTAAEFVQYAQKHSGNVTVATQGSGSTSHLTGEMFAAQAGTKFLFVPYRGTSPALVDLMAGQVDVFFDNIASMSKLHESGKAKILAVASAKRSSLMPGIPTLSETVAPGFDVSTFFSIAAPAGTPVEITQKLNGAIREILAMKEVQQRFLEQGAEIVGNTPAQMSAYLEHERARWKKVIDSAGVKLN